MTTLVFDQEYRIARDTPSDINEHIESIKKSCKLCKTRHRKWETRTGVSTRAFLAADVNSSCIRSISE